MIDPLWKLSEDYSVLDAAALIAGYEPTEIDRCSNDTYFDTNFPSYSVTLKAITQAIINLRLKAQIRHSVFEQGYALRIVGDEYKVFGDVLKKNEALGTKDLYVKPNGEAFFVLPSPDWALTSVTKEDLVNWLSSRGIKSGFFFDSSVDAPNYLDKNHPRYAPKLAASVHAWLAMENSELIVRKSAKQALAKWLRENSARFRLSDEEGIPNEKGIEECAKVANWDDKGGAPKTPYLATT